MESQPIKLSVVKSMLDAKEENLKLDTCALCIRLKNELEIGSHRQPVKDVNTLKKTKDKLK